MKNKIISILLIIFFSVTILNLNEVFGVGQVSQCWTQDIDGKGDPDLIFRVFTAASDATTLSHVNNPSKNLVEGGIWNFTMKNSEGESVSYTSTWRDLTQTSNPTITSGRFWTAQYAFHKEAMGDYSDSGSSAGFAKTDLTLTDAIPSIRDSLKVAQHVKVTPKKNKDYNNDSYYNANTFFKVDRFTGEYSDVDYGTQKILTGYSLTKHTQYRETIVNIEGVNILITDHVIYNKDLVKLIAAAKENGKTDGCYVSQILISASKHSNGGAEVARTLYDFIRFYNKDWHPYTTGTENASKGLGGGGNLYDNELIFPQMSKRTVLVRHINIGNNKTISTSIINSSMRIASNNLTLKVGERTINGRNTSNTYTGYEEYYEEIADVDKAITKEALADTNKYKCIGYNVVQALSYASAAEDMSQLIAKNNYDSGKVAEVPGRSPNGDNDYVIIDFYYTEHEADVTVNHYYTDKNGYVKELARQTIIPNTTAKFGTNTINRKNNDRYIKEVYSKKYGQNIIVTTANSLKNNEDVVYKGYEMFTAQDKANGKVVGILDQGSYENTGATATIGTGIVQVNFYYTIEKTEELAEPEKKLDGKVFVKNTEKMEASCQDMTTEKPVTSIPSGSVVKVGIKDIPKYMIGAVTSEYVSPASVTHHMNLTIKLTMGKQKDKTIELKNIPYKVGYYKITDMAVYKLTNVKAYDAEAPGVDTVGESLFEWDEKTLNLNNMGYSIAMKGINNTTITNNTINNINNYVAVQITGKSPATNINIQSERNNAQSTVRIPYLTITEFNKVDANNDSAINETDKIYAQEMLANYNRIYNEKLTEESEALTKYEQAVAELNRLKSIYDEANNRLAELDEIYNDKKAELNTKENSINQIIGEIEQLEKQNKQLQDQIDGINRSIVRLNESIAEYELKIKEVEEQLKKFDEQYGVVSETKAQLENEITKTNRNLQNIENNSKKSEQYRKWQQEIANRKSLEMAAQCQDSVDEEVYIYLEQDQKDALEQCKEAKEAYEKNLQNQVVEKAEKTYNEYVQSEKQKLEKQIEELNAKLNIVNERQKIEVNKETYQNDINDTNSKISTMKEDISQKEKTKSQNELAIASKESLSETIKRDYKTYYSEQVKPAKDNYDNYKKDIYNPAKKAYDDYVAAKIVESALKNWQDAVAARIIAETNFNKYTNYVETMNTLYDSYKAMYDEFIGLTNENAASKLGLKLNVEVQNMAVTFKVGNYKQQLLTSEQENKNVGTFNVTDLQKITDDDDKRIPQVYTQPIKIDEKYYHNLSEEKITHSDYNGTDEIPKQILNGVRVLAGDAKYELQRVIGNVNSAANNVVDTVYYNMNGANNDGETTKIFKLSTNHITKKYEINNLAETYDEKHKYVEPINIYTPITVSATLDAKNNNIVDQTQDLSIDKSMIQLNTSFTIEIANKSYENRYRISDTSKYALGYYIKFDFEVHNVYINGKKYKNGDRISPDVWIGMFSKGKNGKTIVEAQAYGNIGEDSLDIISEDNRTYTVRAVAYNATELMRNESIRYDSLKDMTEEASGIKNTVYNICTNPSYFAQTAKNDLVIINRMFDFRVTDVKDLNWKSVFRTSSGSSTNNHKGILYYSGTTKWNTKSDKSNDIIQRTTAEIGKTPLRTLPIGPYKNTDSTYIKAPKMGYRFSFDLKVTGAYYDKQGKPRINKKVEITTKFYYISKDGSRYLKESDGNSEGIYLFYKNSQGRYVRIDDNGGGYDLTFTPDDGYRYLDNGDKSNLAKSVKTLGNLRKITLTYQMATVAPNRAVITYYGDYKLPNSTIAVEVKRDGTYDINKPLKDGYIGVIFDIVAYSGTSSNNEVKLSYSKDTKDGKANTSQWVYEGFLDYTKPGEPIKEPISIKLEKGSWKIDNKTYNDIKGSVILYDLDERAATDYE